MDNAASPGTPSALGAPGRRRNGRLQACEPCRKRKVSCDHGVPVCRRCRARASTNNCVYLAPGAPEPQTRSSAVGMGRKPTRRVSSTVVEGAAASSPQETHNVPTPGLTTHPASPETSTLPPETSPGYLGFTSFSAVYQETQNSLSLVQGATILSSMRMPSSDTTPSTKTTMNLTPHTLEICMTVLRRIPGHDFLVSLYKKHQNPNDGWIRLAGQRLAESLPTAFGRELRLRRASDLEAMAQLISANTAKPWSEDEPDAQKWLASFSGRNMRWECIGILFTYWGLAALAENPHRPEHMTLDEVEPRRMTIAYKDAAELCIDLCKGCAPNSLVLYLMHKVAILESMLAGDASPSFWWKYGELVATATYLGLHAMPHDSSYRPTASTEARRRLISQIFVIDKVGASFAGRPPLLGRRYLLTPPPADLSDEVLLSDAETIDRELGRLDERGWNRGGHNLSMLRARRFLMVIKDEVMEFALGQPTSTTVEALLDLRARESAVLSDLPTSLRYHPEDIRDTSMSGPTLYAKALVHLEHLQNFFLIDRLLVQRGHDASADLLKVSSEMVAVTLIFWTHMDRLAGTHGDFEWLVMAYAAPAGGVLCNEPLGPLHHPIITPEPAVTKSGIIQQLSLLVGFLDWVSPGAPNGVLCRSCKAVIQHVLDQALNGVSVSSSDARGPGDYGFDFSTELGADMGGFFNFDLLDTFEWLRPEIPQSQES